MRSTGYRHAMHIPSTDYELVIDFRYGDIGNPDKDEDCRKM